MAHPDLPAEQAYLDEAYESLDRMRETLIRTAGAAATEEAAQAIENWATGRLRTFMHPSSSPQSGHCSASETAALARRAVNAGMALSLLPTKGMALPFLSYGMSSVVASLLAAGMLLSVSGGVGGFLKRPSGGHKMPGGSR